ncbi:neural proliferation differentiation and control protein 1 [Gastrophryne carolinensis]
MGPPRGAGLPLGTTVCFCLLLIRLCAGRPGPQICRSISCSLHRRQVCLTGSKCGPCLPGYTEYRNRTCVKSVDVGTEESAIDRLASSNKASDLRPLDLAQQVNSTPSNPSVPPSGAAGAPSGRSSNPGSPKVAKKPPSDALLLGVVVACAIAGLMALAVALICWCRMRREMKLAEKTDYPAYRQSPPPPYDSTSPGDKKLAQNAQMYHYQHQKQQMISMEPRNKDELKHPDSTVTSDEENEDGDFTVYECPGLAPTGEMEVKNPLFDDSSLNHSTVHPH